MIDPNSSINDHTLPFLEALAGGDFRLTFQTFYDKPGKRRGLARQFHGPFQRHRSALESINGQGAGIFVAVNQTDGLGRSKANIEALRAWWTDLDDKAAKEPFRLELLPLPPTIAVKTPGGWHCYWIMKNPERCDEALLAEHESDLKRIQAALARFGADRQVCEGARVLRLPGFYHCKAKPQLVTLEAVTRHRYSRSQIHDAFPAIDAKPAQSAEDYNACALGKMTLDQARNYVDKLPPAIEGKKGSSTTFTAALKLLSKGLPEAETLEVLMEKYNPRCKPPWTKEELQRKVQYAAKTVSKTVTQRGGKQ